MTEAIILSDKIYGSEIITELVLIDLLNSNTVERHKNIGQLGIPKDLEYLHWFSRYDHLLGTMRLTRAMGGSLEEQTAALLHDVSHMALSHLFDWILNRDGQGSTNEDYQDQTHASYLAQTDDIPNILNEHGMDKEKIFHYEDHFKILEQPAPELCADRVDYSLRELSIPVAQEIYQGLTVVNGQIICSNFQTASTFAREFLNLQRTHWNSRERVSRYYLLAEAFKRAIYDLEAISLDDFYKDDTYVFGKLTEIDDQKIKQILNTLKRLSIPRPKPDDETILLPPKKFRHIDPLFIGRKNQLQRLSHEDSTFRHLLTEAKRENNRGVIVKKV